MEKNPKQVDFDYCVTSVEFNTESDSITCIKSHYKGDQPVSVDTLTLNLKTIPFQTAMGIACEYVRSVVLVDYDQKGK